MNNTVLLKRFFLQTTDITKKYETIAKITGEEFNIFNVTGIGASEVKLHSSLITELLNPCGHHGMGRIFLDHFLKQLEILIKNQSYSINPFFSNNVEVIKEEWIGYIDEQKTSGGFIDIILKTNENDIILIENKIYAKDQPRQLRRYFSKYNKALIIYLTLQGREAEINTTCNDEFPNQTIYPLCISYKEFIISWLNECKISSIDKPLIRETLTQYLFLVKQLTNQNTNSKMENEMAELITSNSEYIKIAKTIWDSQGVIKLSIIKKTIDATLELAKESNLKAKIWESTEELGKKDSGFVIYLSNELPLWISFYFTNPDDIEVGIDWIDKKQKNLVTETALKSYFSLLASGYNLNNNDDWMVWKKLKSWEETPWSDIQQEMPLEFIKEAKNLIKIMENFKLSALDKAI